MVYPVIILNKLQVDFNLRSTEFFNKRKPIARNIMRKNGAHQKKPHLPVIFELQTTRIHILCF